jgi:hypothetical protein
MHENEINVHGFNKKSILQWGCTGTNVSGTGSCYLAGTNGFLFLIYQSPIPPGFKMNILGVQFGARGQLLFPARIAVV